MKRKILAGVLAAVMIGSSFSTTAFAALGKTDTVSKIEQQKSERKVIKRKSAVKEEKQKEADWQQEMLKLVNAERKKNGLSELKLDEKISKAAQVRAKECLESYSHTRPDGRSLKTAMDDAGVTYSWWGENLHEKQKTSEGAMKSWMNSEGHKANILNEKFDSVGFGRAKDKNGTYYMVQMFAKVK